MVSKRMARAFVAGTVAACAGSAFGQLSAARMGEAPAAGAPLTFEQAAKRSTETLTIDPSALKDRDLRAKAMQEAALSYGARSGLLRRSFEIRKALESTGPQLDAIWNFRPLMLTDAQPGEAPGTMRQRMIVPPVIVQAESILRQDGGGLIRLVDKTYKLNSAPRFSSTAPTWRDYLFRDLGETTVALPHVSLLPRTSEERGNWDRWIAEGWQSGQAQADAYLEFDLNRLYRDFDGMVTYHEMVAKRMVSLPYVSTSNESVSGDETTMNINDSLLRITVMPAFQHNSKQWKALQNGRR